MNKYIVVSLSGGKDSTAMLLRMIELKEHIDEVVCCDTTKEFPEMLKHIAKVKSLCENEGIKFTILKSEKSFDYYMFEHPRKKPNPKYSSPYGYSWSSARCRWCTNLLKTSIINRHLSNLAKQYELEQCIGIASDERYRLERESNKRKGLRFPLVEWGWSEKDCLEYCYSKGFDWGGLYEIFDRASCWCCPLASLSDIKALMIHFPELWEELKSMDSRSMTKFKPPYSVEDLEIKFKLEDDLAKQGINIRSREARKLIKQEIEKANLLKKG